MLKELNRKLVGIKNVCLNLKKRIIKNTGGKVDKTKNEQLLKKYKKLKKDYDFMYHLP